MQSLFPTYLEKKSLKLSSALMAELKRTALKLPEVDDAGREWCKKNYRKGYTSYGSMANLHQQFSVIDQLKTMLDREVKAYAKKLGFKFPTGALELSSIWVNVMPADCYHAFHAHPLSVISGTFYVDVPKGGSPLRIEDPRSALFMASPARKIQLDLAPKNGEVILFESWLKHEVPPHSDSKPRISISFNYDWLNR
jgi:uncharacterized protein (TIGR02466 family)